MKNSILKKMILTALILSGGAVGFNQNIQAQAKEKSSIEASDIVNIVSVQGIISIAKNKARFDVQSGNAIIKIAMDLNMTDPKFDNLACRNAGVFNIVFLDFVQNKFNNYFKLVNAKNIAVDAKLKREMAAKFRFDYESEFIKFFDKYVIEHSDDALFNIYRGGR